LPRHGAKLLSIKPAKLGVEVEVEYEPKDPDIEVAGVKEIQIIPFSDVLEDLSEEFRRKGLMSKDFVDPIMRSIQWLNKLYRRH